MLVYDMKEYNVPFPWSQFSVCAGPYATKKYKNHIWFPGFWIFPSSDIERDPIAGNFTIVPRPSLGQFPDVLWSDQGWPLGPRPFLKPKAVRLRLEASPICQHRHCVRELCTERLCTCQAMGSWACLMCIAWYPFLHVCDTNVLLVRMLFSPSERWS